MHHSFICSDNIFFRVLSLITKMMPMQNRFMWVGGENLPSLLSIQTFYMLCKRKLKVEICHNWQSVDHIHYCLHQLFRVHQWGCDTFIYILHDKALKWHLWLDSWYVPDCPSCYHCPLSSPVHEHDCAQDTATVLCGSDWAPLRLPFTVKYDHWTAFFQNMQNGQLTEHNEILGESKKLGLY